MNHFTSHVTQTPHRPLGKSMIAPGLLHLGQCRLILLVIVFALPVILVAPMSRSYSWGWYNVQRIAQLRVSSVLVDVEVVSERLTNLGSIRVVGKVLEMRVGPAQNPMPSRLIRRLESWAEPRSCRLSYWST